MDIRTITTQTEIQTILDLCEEYPELDAIVRLCLPEIFGVEDPSKVLYSIGERESYNAMLSINLILEELRAGRQVLYPRGMRAGVSNLEMNGATGVFLFHRHPGRPWVFVIPAGDEQRVDVFHSSGIPIASELDKLEVNTGVWLYGKEKKQPVAERMEEFADVLDEVRGRFTDMEDYAVFGFDTGGVLAGMWGTESLGFQRYEQQTPGLIVCAFAPLSETQDCGELQELITKNYPLTYLIHGELDEIVPIANSEVIDQALTQNAVYHRFNRVADAPHNFGKGFHTQADGWLADACAFWQDAVKKEGNNVSEKINTSGDQ